MKNYKINSLKQKKIKTRKMRNTSNSKGSGSKIENRRHFFPSHSTPAARACRRASYKLQRDPYVFTKRSKPSQWTWLLWPEIPSKTRRVSNRRLRSSLLWKTTASRNKWKECFFWSSNCTKLISNILFYIKSCTGTNASPFSLIIYPAF